MSDEQTQMDIEWDEGDDKSSVVYVGTSREYIGLTELGLASDLQDSEMEDDEDSKQEDDEDSKKEDDEDPKKEDDEDSMKEDDEDSKKEEQKESAGKSHEVSRSEKINGAKGTKQEMEDDEDSKKEDDDSKKEDDEDSKKEEQKESAFKSHEVSRSEKIMTGSESEAGDLEREGGKGVSERTAAAVQPKVMSKGPARAAAAVQVKGRTCREEQVSTRTSRLKTSIFRLVKGPDHTIFTVVTNIVRAAAV